MDAAPAKLKKTPQKQIDYVRQNYHQRGGREKQLIRYHFNIHPELDKTTFYPDLEPIDRLIKLKEYHFQERIKRNTEKFNKKFSSQQCPTGMPLSECYDGHLCNQCKA
jgi:hypothetical protein